MKKQLTIKAPGVKLEDTIEFIYNNFKDTKEGVCFVKNKVGKKLPEGDFLCKTKKGTVGTVTIKPDHANVILEFDSIKDLENLVKYMKERIKIVKPINKKHKMDGVMGTYAPDLTIMLKKC